MSLNDVIMLCFYSFGLDSWASVGDAEEELLLQTIERLYLKDEEKLDIDVNEVFSNMKELIRMSAGKLKHFRFLMVFLSCSEFFRSLEVRRGNHVPILRRLIQEIYSNKKNLSDLKCHNPPPEVKRRSMFGMSSLLG